MGGADARGGGRRRTAGPAAHRRACCGRSPPPSSPASASTRSRRAARSTRCRPPRRCRSGGRSTPTGAARMPASTASPADRTPGSSSTPAADFDREIVVKVNVAEVLRRELARPSWRREHVALGTNTDPYQRAEGRYRLMPGVVRALAAAGHAVLDPHQGHPAAPRPAPDRRGRPGRAGRAWRCRWESTTRRCRPRSSPARPGRGRGSSSWQPSGRRGSSAVCSSRPCCPGSPTGRTSSTRRSAGWREPAPPGSRVIPLHLRPGAREWFLAWLAREHPRLVPRYRQLYARGAYVPAEYREWLRDRVGPLLERHGFAGQRPTGPCPAPACPATRSPGSRPAACRGFGRPGRKIRCSRP